MPPKKTAARVPGINDLDTHCRALVFTLARTKPDNLAEITALVAWARELRRRIRRSITKH